MAATASAISLSALGHKLSTTPQRARTQDQSQAAEANKENRAPQRQCVVRTELGLQDTCFEVPQEVTPMPLLRVWREISPEFTSTPLVPLNGPQVRCKSAANQRCELPGSLGDCLDPLQTRRADTPIEAAVFAKVPSQPALLVQEVSSPALESPAFFGTSPEVFGTALATPIHTDASTRMLCAMDALEMSFTAADLFGDSPDALRTLPATPIEPAVSATSSVLVTDGTEVPITVPESAFTGAYGLARLWGHEMLVRKTFIEVVSLSPRGRTATSPLAGNTEPKDFAPQSFEQEEPATANESPVVISLKELLTPAVPRCDGKVANPIKLSLNVWIPPSTSRASTATELPQKVRLSEHHFPMPSGTDSVCRCLF